jgi:hypothetical protein
MTTEFKTDDQLKIEALERELHFARQGILDRQTNASPLYQELLAFPPDTGIPVHFRGTLTYQSEPLVGVVSAYGDETLLTVALYDLGRDRNGFSWWDVLDDEADQSRRWGRRMICRGPWPHDEPRLEPGSVEWEIAQQVARQGAASIPDDETRRAALARVAAEYGPAPASNRTTATYRGDHEPDLA